MVTRAHAPVGTLNVRLPLSGQPRDAAAARAFLRRALTGRLPDETLDTAELLVSELVTNAIQHAGTEVTVDIAHGPDLLRVAVTDGDPPLPRRAAAPADERGRGLTLIAALTQAWGVGTSPAASRSGAC